MDIPYLEWFKNIHRNGPYKPINKYKMVKNCFTSVNRNCFDAKLPLTTELTELLKLID